MRSVLAISFTELRRMVRDRVALFFVFVFPVILILLIGASFGGGFVPKVGVVNLDEGELGDEIVETLRSDESVDLEVTQGRAELLAEIERGILEAGVVVPAGYSSAIRGAREAAIDYVAKPGDFSTAVRAAVDAAVQKQSARARAALVTARNAQLDFDEAYGLARQVEPVVATTDVRRTTAGEAAEVAGDDRFRSGASTQLILFTFVNSLAGSAALVQTRQYGVLRRMLAAPISPSTILAGETFGRFLVAGMQGLFIIVAAALIFGVNWGDPIGAASIVILFALVSTGAAMVAGSVLSNEQQAGALVPFGLALAALGGSMVPLEVFPDTMRTIARITPHAWANEAFDELTERGAGVTDIAVQLGVLAAFAAMLMTAGSMLLRRTLTR